MWHKLSDTLPPEDVMVLLSWGAVEGSAVGYRSVYEEETSYVIEGNTSNGDDPEWWMYIPDLPAE